MPAVPPARPHRPPIWISTYADGYLQERTEAMVALLNRLVEDVDGEARARLARHYLTCSRYEWKFFDAASKKESWPV